MIRKTKTDTTDANLKQHIMVMFRCMGFNKANMPKFQWWPCGEHEEITDHKLARDVTAHKSAYTKIYTKYRTLLNLETLDDKTIAKMNKSVVEMTILHTEPMWIDPATFSDNRMFPFFKNLTKV
jgi:hypothetical protein